MTMRRGCAWIIAYCFGIIAHVWSATIRTMLMPFPYATRYYIFATYVTIRSLLIWAISIAIKLYNKIRGPRASDLFIPLQAAETIVDMTASAIKLPMELAGVKMPTRIRRSGTTTNVADMVAQENDCPFVLVHGVFGWGETFWMPSYWGGIEMMDRKVFMVALGPLSSHHDRACELFYQLKGGTVDYGEAHAKKHQHARYGRKYDSKYPEWNSRKPLHFIGHSMGGATVRYLQHLLDRKFFPGYPDTSADWIRSLSCVSTPHNGATFCDFLGLADDNISIRPLSLLHIAIAFVSIADWFGILRMLSIDFRVEHFGFRKMGFVKLLRAVLFAEHPLVKTGDWCAPDCSIRGAMRLNKLGSFRSTYYFSYVTRQSDRRLVTGHHWPSPQCHWPVMWISACVGAWEPQRRTPVFPGFKASEWWENDGVVSVRSMSYPMIPKHHAAAPIKLPEPTQSRKLSSLSTFEPQKGVWYFSSPIRMDHMTVSMAPRSQKQEHRTLYLHVLGRGRKLKNSKTDLTSLLKRSHVDLVTLAKLPKSPPASPSETSVLGSPHSIKSDENDTDSVDSSDDRKGLRTPGGSRIRDWTITPPLDLDTMSRAKSYSDLTEDCLSLMSEFENFHNSSSVSSFDTQSPDSIGRRTQSDDAPSPLEFVFRTEVKGPTKES